MDLDELMRGLTALVAAHEADAGEHSEPEGPSSNFDCVGCEGCQRCRFCAACRDCEDCTYCEECVDCVSCTHVSRSVDCSGASHLRDCRGCEDSRYLTLCVDCVSCTYCLGCVGLENAEFYVLNESVSRSQYFKLVKALSAEIEVRTHLGWRPPVVGLETMSDDGHADSSIHDDGTKLDDGEMTDATFGTQGHVEHTGLTPRFEGTAASSSTGWISAIVDAQDDPKDPEDTGAIPEVTHTRMMDEKDVRGPSVRSPLEGPMVRPRSAGRRTGASGLSLVDLDDLDGPDGPDDADDAVDAAPLVGIDPPASRLGIKPKQTPIEPTSKMDDPLGGTAKVSVLDTLRRGDAPTGPSPSLRDATRQEEIREDHDRDVSRPTRGRLTRGRRPLRPTANTPSVVQDPKRRDGDDDDVDDEPTDG